MALKMNGNTITDSTSGYFTVISSSISATPHPTAITEGYFGFFKNGPTPGFADIYTNGDWRRLEFSIPIPDLVSFTLQHDTGISTTDSITNNGTLIVSGINVINGFWQYSTDAGATWSQPQPTDINTFNLLEGTYLENSIQVKQTNAVGYSSTTTNTSQIIVDTTAPTVVINPVSSDDILTYADVDTTAITGTVSDAGSAVTLTFNTVNRTASVSGNNWTYTVTEADLEALGEGSGKTITASATDLAGNTGSISRTVTVNTWGSALFTSPTTTTWTPPLPGIKKVHVVAIGGGAAGTGGYGAGTVVYSGGGGGYGYKNNIPVTFGANYNVTVGHGGSGNGGSGGSSWFIDQTTVRGSGAGYSGGSYTGDGGDYGEDGLTLPYNANTDIRGGSAGGNPGSKGGSTTSPSGNCGGGGGASVYGLSVAGRSGSSGYRDPDNPTTGVYYGGSGGMYGGGGGGRHGGNRPGVGGNGASGAVRVVWGIGRAFPSTNVHT